MMRRRIIKEPTKKSLFSLANFLKALFFIAVGYFGLPFLISFFSTKKEEKSLNLKFKETEQSRTKSQRQRLGSYNISGLKDIDAKRKIEIKFNNLRRAYFKLEKPKVTVEMQDLFMEIREEFINSYDQKKRSKLNQDFDVAFEGEEIMLKMEELRQMINEQHEEESL